MVGDGCCGNSQKHKPGHLASILFADVGLETHVPELLRTFDVFLLTSLWEGPPIADRSFRVRSSCCSKSRRRHWKGGQEGRNGF
jgi:hypothetical protein